MRAPVLLTIRSHHGTSIPELPRDLAYLGYYANVHGEQFVYVYDRATSTGTVYVGNADWKAYPIGASGQTVELVLSADESRWLRACWNASTGIFIAEVG